MKLIIILGLTWLIFLCTLAFVACKKEKPPQKKIDYNHVIKPSAKEKLDKKLQPPLR